MSAEAAANPKASCNVQVAVRCRPLNSDEKRANQSSIVTCESEAKTVKISYGQAGKKTMKSFNFDKVFGVYSRQEEVYESMVRPIVDEVLEGFNCTIFAYGQTGTGKTHTMEGDINSEEQAGIVPRSVRGILQSLENSDSEFTIRVSFLELYNEELQDLLNISGEKKLKLCEDVKKGVVCQNLEEITVLNEKDIFEILARGIQQRQTAATLCNKNSSRSHSIFTMKIMIKECNVEGEEVIRHGQLNLVDLAGSECVGRSGAKNDRAREAGSINQSLLTLGRVITALVDHHGHIPYRDSKLTRLLQESLGGKAKTCIIATLSPSQGAVEESMSTLDYAYRAKSIKNQPTLNQRLTKKVIMKEYLAEVETLKMQLMQTREKNGVYVDPQEYYAMESRLAAQESQILECEGALAARNEEIKQVRVERDDVQASMEALQEAHAQTQTELGVAQESLGRAQEEVCTAFVEMSAAEAVVGEQKQTEAALWTQGTSLQKDLHRAQGDMGQLLSKVDTLKKSEGQKLKDTEDFVAQLNSSGEMLAAQVKAFGSSSEAHSDSLKSGVTQMLQHGRQTCSTLKAAIETALTTMIGDAEQARDEMVTSCGGLKTHLGATNTHIETTLRTLQGQLSDWLGEVDTSMQQAQEQLTFQSKQIATVSSTIDAHCVELKSLSSAFVETQEELRNQTIQCAEELQTDLRQQLQAYQATVETQATAASKTLEDQAAAMEKAMQAMLKEMVASSNNALTTSMNHAKDMTNAAVSSIDAGVSSITSAQNNIHAQNVAHASGVTSQAGVTNSTFTAEMSVLTQQRDSADEVLSTVSGAVGNKRKFLDSTITELCSSVHSAIQEGVDVVDQTSATAKNVLSNVSTAAQSMNATASEAMDGFTSYIESEGKTLTSTLDDHFTAAQVHVVEAAAAVGSLQDSADRHDWRMSESATQSSGTTPTKVVPSSVGESPLKRTRNHGEIRDDTKQQLISSGSAVSYETAREAIHTAANAPAATAGDGVDDANMDVSSSTHATSLLEDSSVPAAAASAEPADAEEAEAGMDVLSAPEITTADGVSASAGGGEVVVEENPSLSVKGAVVSKQQEDVAPAPAVADENSPPNVPTAASTSTKSGKGGRTGRSKIATLSSGSTHASRRGAAAAAASGNETPMSEL